MNTSRIDEWLAECPFRVNDTVRVIRTGETGSVAYIYYNGFCLLGFEARGCTGGLFSNDSTYRWKELEKVGFG
jgi:hypothetical protein